MTSQKVIDFEKAKQTLSIPAWRLDLISDIFQEYSPSYVLTNEDIRTILALQSVKDKNVLTVAGGGEHPMFYKMAGAKNVDAFDISYCAKAIMDLKTTALPMIDNFQFNNFVFNLYDNANIFGVPNFS